MADGKLLVRSQTFSKKASSILCRRKIVAIALSGAILLILLVLARTPTHPKWACGGSDNSSGCLQKTGLNVSATGSEYNRISDIDVSDDGSKILATVDHSNDRMVLEDRRSWKQLGPPSSFSAIFDSSSGQPITTFQSEPNRHATDVLLSSDDSLAAVLFTVYSPPNSEGNQKEISGEVMIYNTDTGQIVQRIPDTPTSLGEFYLTEDNTLVGVGIKWYLVSTGAEAPHQDNQILNVDILVRSRNGYRPRCCDNEETFTFENGPTEPAQENRIRTSLPAEFTSRGDLVSSDDTFLVATTSYQYGWARRLLPKFTRPSSTLAIVNLSDGTVIKQFDLDIKGLVVLNESATHVAVASLSVASGDDKPELVIFESLGAG